MSQVFPLPYIDDPMYLAFQGFYERDRATGKVAGFHHRLYTRHKPKHRTRPAAREELPGFLTLNKIGPA
jgi:hypothetical protein